MLAARREISALFLEGLPPELRVLVARVPGPRLPSRLLPLRLQRRNHATDTLDPSQSQPAKGPPPNIFSFFDDIGKHAVSRPSYRLDLGVAAYPKSALSGASRKQQLVGPQPGDSDYLSVGVGEDAYFRRFDAIGVADG